MASPKKVGFILEINGAKDTIEQVAALELQLQDVTKQINAAKKAGDQELYKNLRVESANLRQEIKDLNKGLRDQVKQFKDAQFPEDSYRGLNRQLVEARKNFRELSASERDAAKGKSLLAKIGNLDQELKDLDKTLGQNFRNVGNYEEAIERALGGLTAGFTGNLSDLIAGLGIGGAIGQGVQIVGELIGQVSQLTKEFDQLRASVQQFSNADGAELDDYVARVAASAKTFNEEQTNILSAASNISRVFNVSFSEALDKIDKGFIQGSNAGGDFLELAKEYSPVFEEIGLNADQAFRFINQTVSQGIYSDNGLAVIEEAQLRLRELPQSTIDALNAIGLTGEEIQKTIGEEGIGGAIALVSSRLGEFENDSQQVGQVLADVFGAAGEKVGVEFVKSLSNINKEIDNTIGFTNAYQFRLNELLQSEQELASAQNRLTKELSGFTEQAQILGNRVLSNIVSVATELLDTFGRIVKVPLSQSIREQQGELNALVGALINANDSEEIRNNLINEIQSKYPSFLQNIDLETATTEQLKSALEDVNRQFVQKILLQEKEEALGEIIRDRIDLIKFETSTRVRLEAEQDKAKRKSLEFVLEGTRKQIKALDEELKKEEEVQNAILKRFGIQSNPPAPSSDQKTVIDEEIEKTDELTEKARKLRGSFDKSLRIDPDAVAKTSVSFLSSQIDELRKKLEEAPDVQSYKTFYDQLLEAELNLNKAIVERRQVTDASILQDTTPIALGNQQSDAQGNIIGSTSAEDSIQSIIDQLQLQNQVEQALEAENQRVLTELAKQGEEDRKKNRLAAESAKLAELEAQQAAQNEILRSGLGEVEQLTTDLFSGQVTTFKEFQKQIIKILLDSAERVIQLEIAKAFGISLSQPDSIATFGASGLAKFAIVSGLVKAFFAGIKSQVSNFASGGQVPYDLSNASGRIKVNQNVSRQASGDNVLAYVKRGEVILNKDQQRRISALYGPNVFGRIGVPGFVDGGVVGSTPQLVNPNAVIQSSSPQSASANFQSDQIVVLASVLSNAISQSVAVAVRKAIGEGLNDSNRRMEREELSNQESSQ